MMTAAELEPYVRRNLGRAGFVVDRFAHALVDDHFDDRWDVAAQRDKARQALVALARLSDTVYVPETASSKINPLGAMDLVLDVVGWLASYREPSMLRKELAAVTDFCQAAQRLWEIGQSERSYASLRKTSA